MRALRHRHVGPTYTPVSRVPVTKHHQLFRPNRSFIKKKHLHNRRESRRLTSAPRTWPRRAKPDRTKRGSQSQRTARRCRIESFFFAVLLLGLAARPGDRGRREHLSPEFGECLVCPGALAPCIGCRCICLPTTDSELPDLKISRAARGLWVGAVRIDPTPSAGQI